jgi:hypothetical protein
MLLLSAIESGLYLCLAVAASVGYDGIATAIDSGIHGTYKPHGGVFNLVNADKECRLAEGLLETGAGLALDGSVGAGHSLSKFKAGFKKFSADIQFHFKLKNEMVHFKSQLFENLGDALPNGQKSLLVHHIMKAGSHLRSVDLKGGNHVLSRMANEDGTKIAEGFSMRARIDQQIAAFHRGNYLTKSQATKDKFFLNPDHPRYQKSILSTKQAEVVPQVNRRLETCAEHEAATNF